MIFETTYNESFREVAAEPETVVAKIVELRKELKELEEIEVDTRDQYWHADVNKRVTWLADGLRLIGEWQESVQLYDVSYQYHDDRGAKKAMTLVGLKRALVLGEIDSTVDPFVAFDAPTRTKEYAVYRQFFCEFHARFLFAQSNWALALENLDEALEIRTRIGNERHIAHTKTWIDRVRGFLDHP